MESDKENWNWGGDWLRDGPRLGRVMAVGMSFHLEQGYLHET